MSLFRWELVRPGPGEAVGPGERLSWGRTAGVGLQHVLAMFGATFVFPVLMGLDPNLAIFFSGVSTIMFLLVCKNRVPSYLGTSASFVAGVAAIRAQGGDSADVTGAILVAGLLLLVVGVIVHFAGPRVVAVVLPPAVSGAVVMLIGFYLAPVVATEYWPLDPWVGLITATAAVVFTVALPGFWSRVSIVLALGVGVAVSVVLDALAGPITSCAGDGCTPTTAPRVSFSEVGAAPWFGLPDGTLPDGVPAVHAPSFSAAFVVLVLPAVIALVAENTGHVRAVARMTGEDLDPYVGRALGADGAATALASAFGGSPATTYAENIGVMGATRVYSTAAYHLAALVAIVLGFSPKFGAVVSSIPGGVLGGVTLVLYGMIGLVGAKIWIDHGVDFADPVNTIGLAAGLIAGIGGVELAVGGFTVSGVALGTILVLVYFHLARVLARRVSAAPPPTPPTGGQDGRSTTTPQKE